MTFVEMPKANENLTEATLDRWLVKVGERVEVETALCEIITDKAKFEMPSPRSGVVLAITAAERSMLPVGYTLCILGNEGETPDPGVAARNSALLAAHQGAVVTTQGATLAGGFKEPAGAGVRATPAARRVAKELNVDLAEVAKARNISGPVGEKDVREFAAGLT